MITLLRKNVGVLYGTSRLVVSEESWLKTKNIDLLKLRASYNAGTVERTGAGRYPYQVFYLAELVMVIRKAISEVTTRAKQAIVTINGKYPI